MVGLATTKIPPTRRHRTRGECEVPVSVSTQRTLLGDLPVLSMHSCTGACSEMPVLSIKSISSLRVSVTKLGPSRQKAKPILTGSRVFQDQPLAGSLLDGNARLNGPRFNRIKTGLELEKGRTILQVDLLNERKQKETRSKSFPAQERLSHCV